MDDSDFKLEIPMRYIWGCMTLRIDRLLNWSLKLNLHWTFTCNNVTLVTTKPFSQRDIYSLLLKTVNLEINYLTSFLNLSKVDLSLAEEETSLFLEANKRVK